MRNIPKLLEEAREVCTTTKADKLMSLIEDLAQAVRELQEAMIRDRVITHEYINAARELEQQNAELLARLERAREAWGLAINTAAMHKRMVSISQAGFEALTKALAAIEGE